MRLEELNVDNWELSCPPAMSAGYREFLKKMVRATQEQQQLQSTLDVRKQSMRRTVSSFLETRREKS